jgi:hypothetical protein
VSSETKGDERIKKIIGPTETSNSSFSSVSRGWQDATHHRKLFLQPKKYISQTDTLSFLQSHGHIISTQSLLPEYSSGPPSVKFHHIDALAQRVIGVEDDEPVVPRSNDSTLIGCLVDVSSVPTQKAMFSKIPGSFGVARSGGGEADGHLLF